MGHQAILKKFKNKLFRRSTPQTSITKNLITTPQKTTEEAILKKMHNALQQLILAQTKNLPSQSEYQKNLRDLMLTHPKLKDFAKRHILHHIAAAGLVDPLRQDIICLDDLFGLAPLDYAAINGQTTAVKAMLDIYEQANCIVPRSGTASNSMSLSDILKYRLYTLSTTYNEKIDIYNFTQDIPTLIKEIDRIQNTHQVTCPTTIADQPTLDRLNLFAYQLNRHYAAQKGYSENFDKHFPPPYSKNPVCLTAPPTARPNETSVKPPKCAA